VRRGFWFVAGAGAGVYVMIRARRAAETFTPDGVRDRLAGLGVGAHLFAEEVRTGMAERETELRDRLGLALDEVETHVVGELSGQSAELRTLEGMH
jgi:hypothetical protein